jgi:nitrogenase delta subunit
MSVNTAAAFCGAEGTVIKDESPYHDTYYVDKIIDYIMKKCLWQFHSRSWDRERQNAGILNMTREILIDQEPTHDSPEDRCYWVDAVMMAKGLKRDYPEFGALPVDDIKRIMEKTKERLDFLTIHGSLNQELTDPKY